MGEVRLELTWAIHPRDFESPTKTLATFHLVFKCFSLLGFTGYRSILVFMPFQSTLEFYSTIYSGKTSVFHPLYCRRDKWVAVSLEE